MSSITIAKSISGNQPEDALAEILFYVKNMRGIDFSAYRVSTISRRLMHRTLPESRFAFALPTEGRAHA